MYVAPQISGLVLQGYEHFRENVVFLIDAQPAMFEETSLVDSLVGELFCITQTHRDLAIGNCRHTVLLLQDFKGDTWFDAAIKTTREILKARIISSDNDQLAVVFYGTVGPNSSTCCCS